MKYLIVVLSLLFAVPTYAGDTLCIGSPIEKVTAGAKAAGFRLVNWEETTCGGGIGEDGRRTEKWKCFIQKWRLTNGTHSFLFYAREDGTWKLSNGRAGDGTIMNLDLCQ